MKQFYTYMHCRPNGMPFYVGKGSGKRAYKLLRPRENIYHQRIVTKYGKENIGVFIFPCDSEQQSFNDEIQQIAQLKREGYELCNLTNGGEGTSGFILDNEIRTILIEKGMITKLRNRKIKNVMRSRTIIKKGQVLDFKQNKGYKKNPESIAKRSRTRKLNRLEREFNLLIWSIPYVRPPISEETRKKMSAAAKRRIRERDENHRFI